MLEALRYSAFAGWDWDECVNLIADGSAMRCLGPDACLRRDALREVGGCEPRVADRFRYRLRSLTDAMPATVTGGS